MAHRLYTIFFSFHSMKLHIFGGLLSTMDVTSRMMRDLSFCEYGEYHFVSLTLPCRLINSKYRICGGSTAV